MITNLSGGSFEIRIGRPWTAGISPYREGEALKLNWQTGRWFFEIAGIQYSAKQITPHLKDIRMHTDDEFF